LKGVLIVADEKKSKIKDQTGKRSNAENPLEEMPEPQISELIHELRVHQLELELQNEELRRSQAEAERSRKAYQELWELSPVAYALIDGAYRVTAINHAGQMIFGRPKNTVLNARFSALVAPENQVAVQLLLEKISESRASGTRQIRIIRPDGSVRFCQLECRSTKEGSEKTQLQVVLTDITERIKAHDTAEESLERLHLATEGARLGTWHWDMKTDKTIWNDRLYDLLGRTPDKSELSGETFLTYIHQDDLPAFREKLEKAVASFSDFEDEFRVVRENGEIKWLATSGRIYYDAEDRPIRMAGINYDITDRKQAEEALHNTLEQLEFHIQQRTADLEDTNRALNQEIGKRKKFEIALKNSSDNLAQEYERRKSLSRRLVDLLEEDRHGIAMALHDHIGQLLTSIKIDLETVESQLAEPSVSGIVRRAKKNTTESISFIREVSHQLRPSTLDDFGLDASLRSLIEEIQKSAALKIHYYVRAMPQQIEKRKELALYRIAQEALNNTIKHTAADKVFINLTCREKSIRMTLEDNGNGFDYEKLQLDKSARGPLGITIMRERAIQAGGNFRIESQPGKGTFVSVEIPID